MKECRSCKIVKNDVLFYKRASNSDGLYSYCIECTLKKNKSRSEEQREAHKKKSKDYKEKNRSILREKAKDYYYKNKAHCLKKREEYRKKNKDKISLREAVTRLADLGRFEKNRIKHFNWSKDNRASLNAYQRDWYQANKEKRKAHVQLNRAIKAGKMVRPSNCSECTKECKPDGHHADYSKPLDVVWICRACHSRKSPRTVIK